MQLTLQILASPPTIAASVRFTDPLLSSIADDSQSIPFLAPLINATLPALLHASIPLSTTCTAATVALLDGKALLDPSPEVLTRASSVHALAFSGAGEILLAESEGSFTTADWELAVQAAQTGSQSTAQAVHKAVEAKLTADEAWREQS